MVHQRADMRMRMRVLQTAVGRRVGAVGRTQADSAHTLHHSQPSLQIAFLGSLSL
jgi:hypothetical protein